LANGENILNFRDACSSRRHVIAGTLHPLQSQSTGINHPVRQTSYSMTRTKFAERAFGAFELISKHRSVQGRI